MARAGRRGLPDLLPCLPAASPMGVTAVIVVRDTGTCHLAVYKIHYQDAGSGSSHLPFLAVSLAVAREAAGLEQRSLGMKHKMR